MKKSNFLNTLMGLSLALTSLSFASPPPGPIDDSLMSSGKRFGNLSVDPHLHPDQVQALGSHPSSKLHFVRAVKNQWTAIPGLIIKANQLTLRRKALVSRSAPTGSMTDAQGMIEFASCPAGTELKLQIQLSQPRFAVATQRRVYDLSLNLPCGKELAIQFKEDSLAGQVMAIWQVAEKAQVALLSVSKLEFWRRQILFSFPENSDFYTADNVHLTLGHRWDVVGHEMGHAIYDQANIGAWGEGAHKIDECYSDELGLSEGWASYFSAWVQIDLNNPDAKFESMVPRRAPIHVENVPADVCPKSQSEWRIMSYLWDLVDLNQDGEKSAAPAKRLWEDLLNGNLQSASSIHQRLLSKNWNPQELQRVWNLNFPAERR